MLSEKRIYFQQQQQQQIGKDIYVKEKKKFKA